MIQKLQDLGEGRQNGHNVMMWINKNDCVPKS